MPDETVDAPAPCTCPRMIGSPLIAWPRVASDPHEPGCPLAPAAEFASICSQHYETDPDCPRCKVGAPAATYVQVVPTEAEFAVLPRLPAATPPDLDAALAVADHLLYADADAANAIRALVGWIRRPASPDVVEGLARALYVADGIWLVAWGDVNLPERVRDHYRALARVAVAHLTGGARP